MRSRSEKEECRGGGAGVYLSSDEGLGFVWVTFEAHFRQPGARERLSHAELVPVGVGHASTD